jgi:NADH-quinone oxidoreductase subunit J
VTTDQLLFYGLSLLAIVSAVSMLVSGNAIYSALFLVLNFLTVAVLYLLLNAAFIAMVQITVYAGAIMVLFLFVIMLLGGEKVEATPSLPWQLPLAIVMGLVLLGEVGYALFSRPGALAASAGGMAEGFGGPAAVGSLLFSRYLLPFEVTSLLLLVAMVGAILLTREDSKEG